MARDTRRGVTSGIEELRNIQYVSRDAKEGRELIALVPSIGESKKGELSDGEVTLKLNRRQSDNSPIWSFDIRGRVKRTIVSSLGNKLMKQSQQNNKPMTISHEVKIHLLSQRRQNEIIEPLCPPPNVCQLSYS
jgi:hypothetical protein